MHAGHEGQRNDGLRIADGEGAESEPAKCVASTARNSEREMGVVDVDFQDRQAEFNGDAERDARGHHRQQLFAHQDSCNVRRRIGHQPETLGISC